MYEVIVRAFRSISFRRTGTFLTLLGIAVGVGAVIIISNIGKCGNLLLNNEIDSLGMDGLSVTLASDDAPLTTDELELIRKIPYVEFAMPLMLETANAAPGNESCQIFLWGIDQTAESVISLNLIDGRYFNYGDIKSGARICMIDEKFAGSKFGTTNVLGRKLTINSGSSSEQYKIVGIIRTGSGLLQNFMGGIIPDFVYIPYSTHQANLSSRNFTQIIIRTDGSTDSETASGDIRRRLERASGRKNSYVVSDMSRQKQSLNNILDIFSMILSAIGAISLFVAGLNIMNVMLASVTERTREIGIKKAIGAPGGYIILEFLCQSLILSLCGGAAGIIGGSVISFIVAGSMGLTVLTGIDIIALMLGFSLLIGTIFGIYPALKASGLDPVEALRYY